MAITASATSARADDHLALGGSNDYRDQHQPARSRIPGARLGAERSSCRTRSSAIPTQARLRRSTTLSRAQLLRPYPQFGNIIARHVTEGKSTYNAGVIEWSKRADARDRRPRQLHLQRAEGQPDRRGELLQPADGEPGTSTLNSFYYVRGGRRYYNPDADFTNSVLRRAAPRDHRADRAAAFWARSTLGDERHGPTPSPAAGRCRPRSTCRAGSR